TQEIAHEVMMTQEEAEAAGYIWVTTADELQTALANNQNVALGGNIDLSSIANWQNTTTYTGTLEGNGYTIVNLTSTTQGLFTTVGSSSQSATIKNLNLENFNIASTNTTGKIGALAGTINGETNIENVHVKGGSITSSGSYVGGLIGYSSNKTLNVASSTSSINVTGKSATGGLIGYIYAQTKDVNIDNSKATGNVTSTGGSAGGFIGTISGDDTDSSYGTINITNSFASGNVTGTERVGSFAGSISISADLGADTSINIINSHASGTATGTNYVGGFSGYTSAYGGKINIEKSSATGAIYGASYVGGFTGYAQGWFGSVYIKNSYTTSNITASGNYVGGLAGYVYTEWGGLTVENSYTSSSINLTGSGQTKIGAFIGARGDYDGSLKITNSYYNTNNGLSDTYGATGKNANWFTATNITNANLNASIFSTTQNALTITNSYSLAQVTATGSVVSGFVGTSTLGVNIGNYAFVEQANQEAQLTTGIANQAGGASAVHNAEWFKETTNINSIIGIENADYWKYNVETLTNNETA
ncbi:hypothetical protein IKA92_04285, partial [bacterium]|nr:hypothetical protein [bacterium]